MMGIRTVLVLMLGICLASGKRVRLSNADKELIVRVHNILRGSLIHVPYKAANMLMMTWNEEAAKKAQKWANTCARGHDKNSERRFGKWKYVGQNYVGTNKGLEFAILYLYSEYQDYDFWNKKCKPNKVCGHFTQVVWHDSNEVGCGVADCSHKGGYKLQLFCNYVPMGNYQGQFPYTIGRPCSKCPNSHPFCVNNLCSKYKQDSIMQGFSLNSLTKPNCVFPFEYEGKFYPDCKKHGRKSWCSEDAIYNRNWHFCKPSKKPCEFPFMYQGKKYDSCIPGRGGSSWCSEEKIFNSNWHYCGEADEENE